MEYACLYCSTTASGDAAPLCGTCQRAMLRAKTWADVNKDGLVSLHNFNPSSRHCAFDCHVHRARRHVYVVVRCKVVYSDDAVVGGGRWFFEKTAFVRNLHASVSLWDARVSFVFGGANYLPYFFLDFVADGAPTFGTEAAQVTATARTSGLPARHPGSTILMGAANALVTLCGPYPTILPAPASGKVHAVVLGITTNSPRTWIIDTADPPDRMVHFAPMAHEFGHMLGLPDEYDLMLGTGGGALTTANIPAITAAHADKDRAVIFWVKLLQTMGVAAPAWGHYGTAANQVNEHSIMRDVDSLARSFLRRHYVTVLEALNYLSGTSSDLQPAPGGGPAWTVG